MGKLVTVKTGFTSVLLPFKNGYRNFKAGDAVTVTDAEYAAFPAATTRAITLTTSGLPEPARTVNADPAARTDNVNATVSGAATATVGWNDWTLTGNVTSVAVNTTKVVNNVVQGSSIVVNPPVYGASPGATSELAFILRQDATGSRTVTWGSAFKFVGAAAPVLSTVASRVDVVRFVSVDGGTTWLEVGRGINVG